MSVETVIEHWDKAEAQLDQLAESAGAEAAGWLDESGLKVLAPLRPRQILQAGANYRKHVIDLAVAHRDGEGTDEEIRERTAAVMDKRAAEGTPYFFIGLPTAMASATDDLVLPAYSQTHDWELEVAAVIGERAFRVGFAITAEHLEATHRATGRQLLAVRRGDVVVLRTGQYARTLRDGWGDYAGGPAPGLSFSTAPWLHRSEIAGIADRHVGVRSPAE